MKNLRAQAAMIGGLSAIVFLGLFVIVSYDHPFTGDVAVEAHPLKQVLQDFRRG
jgi:hypothetical protein